MALPVSPPFLSVASAPTSGHAYSRSVLPLCPRFVYYGTLLTYGGVTAVDGGEMSNIVTLEEQTAALLTIISRVHSFVDSIILVVSFPSWYVIITYVLSEDRCIHPPSTNLEAIYGCLRNLGMNICQ
jgi:hypothetical protein